MVQDIFVLRGFQGRIRDSEGVEHILVLPFACVSNAACASSSEESVTLIRVGMSYVALATVPVMHIGRLRLSTPPQSYTQYTN